MGGSGAGRGPDGLPPDARPGERIVYARQIWPDKATMEAAKARIAEDPRFDAEPPFDAGRLLIGSFRTILSVVRAS